MTDAEWDFKFDCDYLLSRGRIPTPLRLHALGHGNGRNINGAQCRWRVEVMRDWGCKRVDGRWRLP